VKRVTLENGAQRDERSLAEVWESWEQDGRTFWQQMDVLVDTLDGLAGEEVARG
jgi:type I restriction enzyme M protein